MSGNKQYDLYAWVNGKLDAADSAGGWHVRALYYTAGSAYIGYKDVYTGTAESSSLTWQQVGGRLVTPANAASVRLELRVEGVSGWLDFDDVSLQEVLTVNLVYDAENRLVKVLQGGTSTAAFGYDGDGVRVKQVLTATTATSTYFVKNYYEVSGGSATKYYYLGSQRVAMRSSVGVRYLFGDHLGSTSVSADASGGSVTRQLYKAFGEIRYSTNPSLPTNYQYTGQYSDGYINLVWMNSRWYDPALGRWTQPDILIPNMSNPAYFDRFSYVLNNSINYLDPTGHKPCQWGDSNPACDTYSDVDYDLDHQIEKPDDVCRKDNECFQAYLTFKVIVISLHYLPSIDEILYMTAQAEGYGNKNMPYNGSGNFEDNFIEGLARNYYQPSMACERGAYTCSQSKLYKFMSGYQPWFSSRQSPAERADYLIKSNKNNSFRNNLENDVHHILNEKYASAHGWTNGMMAGEPWQWHNYWRAPDENEALGWIYSPSPYGNYFWIMTVDQTDHFKKFIDPIQPHD